MNRAARELVARAEQLGFTLRPQLSGTGHLVLDHPNGTYVIPSTPSEYRSTKNTLAALERIAGTKLPRANHRRSHKANEQTGFTLEGTRPNPHTSARIARLNDTHARLREAWDEATNPATPDIPRARAILNAARRVESALEALHQPITRLGT